MTHISEASEKGLSLVQSGTELSLKGLIEWGQRELRDLGSRESQASAEWILAEVTDLQRSELYLKVDQRIPEQLAKKYRVLVGKRKQRIPLAYVLGKATFWNEDLEVGPGCLIPRPETEILIERFIDHCSFKLNESFSFLDLGCGSGAIAISLLKHFPNATATLADASEEALYFSKKNIETFKLQDRAKVIQSNLFEFLNNQKWNYILSNPPYLAASDWEEVEPEILAEPRQALEGGPEGLDFYCTISKQAKRFLKSEGSLMFEIGYQQAVAVTKLCQQNGFINIQCFYDHAGKDRVILAQTN